MDECWRRKEGKQFFYRKDNMQRHLQAYHGSDVESAKLVTDLLKR